MRLKNLLFFMLFLFPLSAQAAVTSYDNTFVTNDVFAADFHSRLNANFTKSLTGGINSINSANIVDDSLDESTMADEINPRIRTYEGAACEFVYTGLLPSTDSDLTSDISAGTGYPRGYRINKASATSKTYSASKWTYVDLDINGDFQYSVVSIGASAPAVASNSIRLARVSTDGTTINTVTDLRVTSCADGPFSNIGSATGESNLDDVLKYGQPVRRFSTAGRSASGFIQGFYVSWDSHTAFKVTSGSAYINGEYRSISTDITVPTTADDPTAGTSGIVSGAIASSTAYNVYLVADVDATKTPSVSFGTSATGLTNYRLIGRIVTDASSLFTSKDVVTAHAVNERELIGAYVTFMGGTVKIINSFNVSSITDHGAGDYTITFDDDFASADYAWSGSSMLDGAATYTIVGREASPAAGSIRVGVVSVVSDTKVDTDYITFMAVGDTRK